MPSMRSIGFTDSRMIASSLSMSRRRIADWPRLRREDVLRLVHQARALGLDLVADRAASARIFSASASASASARTARAAVGGGRLLGLAPRP